MQLVCGGALRQLNAYALLPCTVTPSLCRDVLGTVTCLRLSSSTYRRLAALGRASTLRNC